MHPPSTIIPPYLPSIHLHFPRSTACTISIVAYFHRYFIFHFMSCRLHPLLPSTHLGTLRHGFHYIFWSWSPSPCQPARTNNHLHSSCIKLSLAHHSPFTLVALFFAPHCCNPTHIHSTVVSSSSPRVHSPKSLTGFLISSCTLVIIVVVTELSELHLPEFHDAASCDHAGIAALEMDVIICKALL